MPNKKLETHDIRWLSRAWIRCSHFADVTLALLVSIEIGLVTERKIASSAMKILISLADLLLMAFRGIVSDEGSIVTARHIAKSRLLSMASADSG